MGGVCSGGCGAGGLEDGGGGGGRRGEDAGDAVLAEEVDLGGAVLRGCCAEGEEGLDWVVGYAAVGWERC